MKNIHEAFSEIIKNILFCVDMDGVLAIWEDASEEETHKRGWFISRLVEIAVVSLVRMLADTGWNVVILSSVYQDDHSAKEKTQWLEMAGLGDIKRIFVPYGENKHDYIQIKSGVTAVLIDDYGKNLTAWEKEGHLAIKFMNGVNNRPRLVPDENGLIRMDMDSWSGYSIDKRMSVKQMYNVVTSVACAVAAEKGKAA